MVKNVCFWVVLALLISFTVFCGCSGETGGDARRNGDELGTFKSLSAETEAQIKSDFLHFYFVAPHLPDDEVYIDHYFGNYNGLEVVAFLPYIYLTWLCTNRFVFICDDDVIGFEFPYQVAMLAWKPGVHSETGQFYEIWEAIDLGLLTRDDIQSMGGVCYDLEPYEDLDSEIERQIKQDYFDYYGLDYGPDDDWFNDFRIDCYFGTYNGYAIIVKLGVWDSSTNIFVYDYLFRFGISAAMFACKLGTNSESGRPYLILQDHWIASDKDREDVIDYRDILTEEDARSMWKQYLAQIYGRIK
ncbi:MAG: hypothetical protein FWD36_01250 [Treponema sp.]|nr:hypothetical protein [Treponema sp.]